MIYNYALRMTSDTMLAEDIVQNVLGIVIISFGKNKVLKSLIVIPNIVHFRTQAIFGSFANYSP